MKPFVLPLDPGEEARVEALSLDFPLEEIVSTGFVSNGRFHQARRICIKRSAGGQPALLIYHRFKFVLSVEKCEHKKTRQCTRTGKILPDNESNKIGGSLALPPSLQLHRVEG